MKLVSVGETTADYYPTIDKTLVGGISLNFAVHAKRCGIGEVSLVSCIGRDPIGQTILDRLTAEGLNVSHVSILDGKTGYCEIVVFENGERYFPPNSYHQNVLATFKLSTHDLAFIQQHEILVSRYDIAYTKANFNKVMCDLAFNGSKVADFGDWFDYDGRHPAIYPYLDTIDLAFISGDQATIETFLPISKRYKAQIVITLGEEGSVALVDGRLVKQPAVPVKKIVDTTGCGDAFQAAFTVRYFRDGNIPAALNAGAENAAKTLQHYGAI